MSRGERRRPSLLDVSPEKAVIWLLFAGVVYGLRSFFSTIFLTYMMTYVAVRVVNALTHPRPDGETSWTRKPVVVTAYAAALVLTYMTTQALVPRTIDQGKWLLAQFSTLDPEKIREDLLAKTLGRWEFSRYKDSDRYTKELQEFIRDKYNSLTFQEAVQMAREIRRVFEEESSEKAGLRILEKLRRSGEFDELYRQHLRTHWAEKELLAAPDLQKRLTEEYDASFRLINGDETYQKEKDQPSYGEKRRQVNLARMTTQLFTTGQHRDTAETEISMKRGHEVFVALTDKAKEEAFQGFYRTEVPKRFRGFHYSYDKFRILESVTNEADFRLKLKDESSDEKIVAEKFQRWMEVRLSKEHPLSNLLGDTSQLLRSSLPHITRWLTAIINSALDFGLNALLSLALSFMIVWEIPKLTRALGSVKGTRSEAILEEIAPEIERLGTVVGVAFVAQFVIAVINAVLAFLALWFLGFHSPVFLSLFVLMCCLVPYVGVLIAALPILLVALQEGGVQLGFQTALSLFVIHELEAWIWSPRILGEFLRMSPLTIILILFVAEPLFGLWGLLLGVPVAVFLINDVFLKPLPIEEDADGSSKNTGIGG